MPGLAGIYDPTADAGEVERTLARMRSVVDVPSQTYTVQVGEAGGVGVVNLLRGSGHASRPVGEPGTWVMLDGELYNGDELREQTGLAPTPKGDAALCRALYEKEGLSFVERLNGQFNLVIHPGDGSGLVLATDRYGYRPLFLAESGSRVLFATEMKALLVALDAAPRFDGVGLLDLMGQGFALGNRTWLEPIRVAEHGSILRFKPHGVVCRRYYELRFRAGGTPPQALAGLIAQNLSRAMRRVTRRTERIGLLLSGGLDSRSALLALEPGNRNVTAFTFGRTDSHDVRFARELAGIAGVPHVHLTYPEGYLGRLLAPLVWRTEGLLPFAEATYTSLCFHPELAAHADVLLYGHCGDTLSGAQLRPSMLWDASQERLRTRILQQQQQVPDRILRRICRRAFYHRFAERRLEEALDTFAFDGSREVADLAGEWNMEQRQRRCTFHSPAVDRYRFDVRSPFLDNDLVDVLLQVPPLGRFQQQIYKRMIVDAFPEASRVPWAYTGRRIHRHLAADLADLARNFAVRRTGRTWRRIAPGRPVERQAFRDLPRDVRTDAGLADVLDSFPTSSFFPGDVLDRSGVMSVVREQRAGRDELTHAVVMLATLATAIRLFLVGGLSMPADADPLAGRV